MPFATTGYLCLAFGIRAAFAAAPIEPVRVDVFKWYKRFARNPDIVARDHRGDGQTRPRLQRSSASALDRDRTWSSKANTPQLIAAELNEQFYTQCTLLDRHVRSIA